MLNLLYLLTFVIPFPFWFLLIFRPYDPLTKRVANSYTIFLLTGIYYILLLIVGVTAPAGTGFDLSGFTTLEGLAKAFGTPLGALIVWSHMIIVDLIAGHWMYHETQRINASRWIASFCILMTLLSGPIGMFLFVLYRILKLRNNAV
jgi:hypothetical protein